MYEIVIICQFEEVVFIVTSKTSVKRVVVSKDEFDGLKIALLEDDQLVEIYFEEADEESLTSSIYLGKIENVVPNLQAAFVNIGEGRNAFLREKDLCLSKPRNGKTLKVEMLKPKQKILVQVKKDAIGLKGPQVTSYISIAGRYLVFMPHVANVGVSKKIADQSERKRLYDIAKSISKGHGLVIRTASEGVDAQKIIEELQLLKKRWEDIQRKFKRARKPQVIYEDSGFLDYIFREKIDNTVDEIIVDDENIQNKLLEIATSLNLKSQPMIRLIKTDAFKELNVEKQILDSLSRTVKLPSGGVLYFDPAEALLVIDVNTGSNTSGVDSEDLILKTNIESAREIPRQLRLRNESGVIVIDFIDMKSESERQLIIHVLEEELKKDKVKTSVGEFTRLGLLEMTRKRTSPPLRDFYKVKCPICLGEGHIISPNRLMKEIVKELQLTNYKDIGEVEVHLPPILKAYLEDGIIKSIEKVSNVKIRMIFDGQQSNKYDIKYKKRKQKSSGGANFEQG
ncbi:MAG: Rne/Rng family ribonuclease [Athalassotoga sp.]|uniref:Rne/Rng family ribonuclease n=1 Tax=Athalassotoga sp. TaxID=2022597 RepID=UPI003D07003F